MRGKGDVSREVGGVAEGWRWGVGGGRPHREAPCSDSAYLVGALTKPEGWDYATERMNAMLV